MMGFRTPDGIAGDLGGGSLEVIEVKGEALRQSVTLPLGGLRLLDAADGRMDEAADIADEEIGRVAWLDNGRNRAFYAVGGTWRAIARLHMEQTDYPLHVMHGYMMPTEDAIDFCEQIRKTRKLSALPGIEEISRQRREVLPYGALVLERLLKKLAGILEKAGLLRTDPKHAPPELAGKHEEILRQVYFSGGARADEVAALLAAAGFQRIEIDRDLRQVHKAQAANWNILKAAARGLQHRYAICCEKPF